jgi:hypothetical protein
VSEGSPDRRSRSGDLLAMVAHDLRPCRLQRRSGTAALVTAEDGTRFDVSVHIDRRKLMTLQELTAHVVGPASGASEGTSVLLHHTGQLRRTGLTAKLCRNAPPEATTLRDRLLDDQALHDACLPLDFTRFAVVVHDGRWRADVRLMGGSHVRTRLPPGGSYVRLAADQVDALLATVRALYRVLPGEAPPPVVPVTATDGPADRPPRSRHLPAIGRGGSR